MFHESSPVIVDNRIRLTKTTFAKRDSVLLAGVTLMTPLGRKVRGTLFWEWQRHIENTGGERFLLTRDFEGAGLTPENCRRWVDAHFQDFSRDANLVMRAHPNHCYADNQEIGRRLYRYIWGCYHKRDEEDPKRRHGHYGPRHPKNHPVYGAALRQIENINTTFGPNFRFHYDIARPELEPVYLA